MIAKPLGRFLRKYPDIRLRVTGPLGFQLDVPERQVVHRDKVPFSEFAGQFVGVWANLAPLEQTPFNQSKSALKALEAGYWGIPTICSPSRIQMGISRSTFSKARACRMAGCIPSVSR